MQMLACQPEQIHRCLHRGHGRPGGELHLGLRIELHGGGRDDAQRAFAAHEQVAQIVAGVVLAQALQAAPDFALRRDHFQPQAQLAAVTVAQHLCAARIGAQVAAQRAAAFASHAQRKQPARIGCGLLHILQDAAGFGRDGLVSHINSAHGVHALQAQYDVAPIGIRHGAAHQPGIAALRNDGHSGRRAGLDHLRHLLRVAGLDHAQGLPLIALAPVAAVRGGIVAGQHMGGAHNARQGIRKSVLHDGAMIRRHAGRCRRIMDLQREAVQGGRNWTGTGNHRQGQPMTKAAPAWRNASGCARCWTMCLPA